MPKTTKKATTRQQKTRAVRLSTPKSTRGNKKQAIPTRLVALATAAVVVVAAVGYGIFAASQKDKELAHVKVGVMMPFSGGFAGVGYGALKGVQLAVKHLDASNVTLVQADSKCDAEAAPAAIKELLDQGVVAIIGEGCSGASLAALSQANAAKVPMISPSASSPELSIAGDYFFRVVPPDEFQGRYAAKLMYDKGIKKASVVFTDEVYGKALSAVFKENFESLGGTVTTFTSIQPDDIDLHAQVAAMKAAQPDGIYLVLDSIPSAAAILKQSRDAGITAPFFGSDALDDSTLISSDPVAAEGLTITTFPIGPKSFKQALVNEFQTDELGSSAPQAYDAFKALYLALEKGATTGEEIKNALADLRFDGISTTIAFDKNGEISNKDYTYSTLQVRDGTFTPVE